MTRIKLFESVIREAAYKCPGCGSTKKYDSSIGEYCSKGCKLAHDIDKKKREKPSGICDNCGGSYYHDSTNTIIGENGTYCSDGCFTEAEPN